MALDKPFQQYFGENDVERAKKVPISNYIEFNRQGFSLCIFHTEKSPSMKYHPERNKIYCHGCQAHKDTIDVVMQLHGVDFKGALKIILNF